jgi:hypothetical protein
MYGRFANVTTTMYGRFANVTTTMYGRFGERDNDDVRAVRRT